MKREFLGEIDQLVGFSYYSFKNRKFRRIHPTDVIKGAIIAASTANTLEDLIYPYSFDEVKDALKNSGKEVLNSKVIKIFSCEEIGFSREYGGVVGSMSFKDVPIHSVNIRFAHDFENFEINCDCGKYKKRRYPSGVWFPAILKEWRLKNKRYSETSCPHICALHFYLKETEGVNALGLDGLDFMKPYVLSFIDVLKRFPEIKEYSLDYFYTYYSSMFDDIKKQVNRFRDRNGLRELRMYSNPYLKNYIRNRMGMSKRLEEKIVNIVGY